MRIPQKESEWQAVGEVIDRSNYDFTKLTFRTYFYYYFN